MNWRTLFVIYPGYSLHLGSVLYSLCCAVGEALISWHTITFVHNWVSEWHWLGKWKWKGTLECWPHGDWIKLPFMCSVLYKKHTSSSLSNSDSVNIILSKAVSLHSAELDSYGSVYVANRQHNWINIWLDWLTGWPFPMSRRRRCPRIL